jgi:alkylhydroperoxidase/carboxymuconolactone decarboxylase family protein YurZ
MTRIPVPALDEIPPASKELLEWIMKTPLTGKVLNMQAQLAIAPASLAGYVALRRTTEEHGTLDPKTRTAVLAMSAAALGVPYVERLTARIASAAGWQPDEIVRFTEGLGSGDEKLDSLLGVVDDAGKNLGLVDDAAWERAAHNGWTPEHLVESFAYFSIAVYTAYFTNFAATELDLPSVLPTEA